MAAIDVHTHAFPDDLAGRAVAKLQADCPWQAVGDGTVDGLLASMDAADVDVSVVCAIATKPDQARGILKWCRKIRSERICPLASVHPATPKAGKWVRRIADAGLAGIKLHPMYQDFLADAPELDEIYGQARESGLVVTLHCGRDIGFPADNVRAAPRRIANIAEKFEGLKLICTHMGGWRMWDEVNRHLIGRNVYLETSFSLGELGEQAKEMIRHHGHDRVLFGTDWPWQRQDETARLLRQLNLPGEQVKAILYGNAAALLGI